MYSIQSMLYIADQTQFVNLMLKNKGTDRHAVYDICKKQLRIIKII